MTQDPPANLGEAYGRLTKAYKVAFTLLQLQHMGEAPASAITNDIIRGAHRMMGFKDPSPKTIVVTRECFQEMTKILMKLEKNAQVITDGS